MLGEGVFGDYQICGRGRENSGPQLPGRAIKCGWGIRRMALTNCGVAEPNSGTGEWANEDGHGIGVSRWTKMTGHRKMPEVVCALKGAQGGLCPKAQSKGWPT